MLALVAFTIAPVFRPAAVFAASGTVSTETPLHDSPNPSAPVIALLPEGKVVSIEGPPVDGFYPVTTDTLSGWLRGETVQVEKDLAASDDAEAMAADPPLDQTGETVPGEASADLDPATDPSLSTTVDSGSDPAANTSAVAEEPPPAADPVIDEETLTTPESDPAAGMAPGNEPMSEDAPAPEPELASTGDVTPAPTTPDGAVPPPDITAPAAEPVIDANVTPIPVAEVAAVGPASVVIDAPILAGPGPDYGVLGTAPAGSTVEKTGHVIDGYVTVQVVEVTGWLALEHLGAPGTDVGAPPVSETAPPLEAPSADGSKTESPSPELVPTEKLPTELVPTEVPPVETPSPEPATAETTPAEVTPIASVPVDMAPTEAAPVDAPPGEVASEDAA